MQFNTVPSFNIKDVEDVLKGEKQHTQKRKGKCSDLLVTKDGVGLDVRGATTDILSD